MQQRKPRRNDNPYPGLHRQRKMLKGGLKLYYYAWRAGPRLPGEPGSLEFEEAWNSLRGAPRPAGPITQFSDLITTYRKLGLTQDKSDKTIRDYRRFLDDIEDRFGDYSVAAMEDKGVRLDILEWRGEIAQERGLRTADYAVSVLSALCSFSIKLGKMSDNRAMGLGHLHVADRSEVVWTPRDVAAFDACAADEPDMRWTRWALRLALFSGMRRGDLPQLKWDDYKAGEIRFRPKKGRRKKRRIIIPVHELPLLESFLEQLPRSAPTVLTNCDGDPLSEDWLGKSVRKVAKAAGLHHLHLHDCRGTALTHVTKLRPSWSNSDIADMFGWGAKTTEDMIKRYKAREFKANVDLEAVARSSDGGGFYTH